MSTTVDPPTGTTPDPMPTSSTLPTTTMPDPPLVDPTKADPATTAAMKKGLSWNSFQQLELNTVELNTVGTVSDSGLRRAFDDH